MSHSICLSQLDQAVLVNVGLICSLVYRRTCFVGVLVVWYFCVCAPFQLSQETSWSRQFKLELLKGPWHGCHWARVFSRLIRSCSTFRSLAFRLPTFPLFVIHDSLPVPAPQQLPGIHLTIILCLASIHSLAGMLSVAICGSQRQLDFEVMHQMPTLRLRDIGSSEESRYCI